MSQDSAGGRGRPARGVRSWGVSRYVGSHRVFNQYDRNNLTRSVECRVAHGLIEFLTWNVSTRQFENAGPRLSVAMGTVKLRFCEVSAF